MRKKPIVVVLITALVVGLVAAATIVLVAWHAQTPCAADCAGAALSWSYALVLGGVWFVLVAVAVAAAAWGGHYVLTRVRRGVKTA